MLLLSRKPGENIVIILADGRKVTVTPVEIYGVSKVRIAIDAPRDVAVWRSELLKEKPECPPPPPAANP